MAYTVKKKNGKKNGNGSGLTAGQKKLPPFLQKKIAAKNKKSNNKRTKYHSWTYPYKYYSTNGDRNRK